MARSRTGIIKPYKYTDSRGRTRYRARVDIGVSAEGKRRRKEVSASTYKECNAKLKELLQEIRENGAPIDKKTGFTTYAYKWLDYKKTQVDPSTYHNYRYCIDLLAQEFGQQTLSSFTATQLLSFINNMKGKKGQPSSINTIQQTHNVTNQIFMQAYQDRLITFNPLLGTKVAKNKDESERRALSVPEIKALLKTATNMGVKDGAIWWFRLLTGLRQGEIIGAMWDDYDETNHTYTVNWQRVRQIYSHGCMKNGIVTCGRQRGGNCPQRLLQVPLGYEYREAYHATFARPKTKTGRVVPIIPALAEVLALYKEATKDIPNPYGLIFRDDRGNPISSTKERLMFNAFVEKAGLDSRQVVGHMTRHSVVTLLASQGVDFQLIKEIVGPSNDATLMHYRHADHSERERAMETLDTALELPSHVEFHDTDSQLE